MAKFKRRDNYFAGGLPDNADSRVSSLYEYWLSIRPTPERLPGRRHLDPLSIPQLLPNLFLLDCVGGPVRYRYRLIGTRVVQFYGADYTGRWLDETAVGFENSPVSAMFGTVLGDGTPVWHRGKSILHANSRFSALGVV